MDYWRWFGIYSTCWCAITVLVNIQHPSLWAFHVVSHTFGIAWDRTTAETRESENNHILWDVNMKFSLIMWVSYREGQRQQQQRHISNGARDCFIMLLASCLFSELNSLRVRDEWMGVRRKRHATERAGANDCGEDWEFKQIMTFWWSLEPKTNDSLLVGYMPMPHLSLNVKNR